MAGKAPVPLNYCGQGARPAEADGLSDDRMAAHGGLSEPGRAEAGGILEAWRVLRVMR